MGCDIHVHIECKIAGQWHHVNAPNIRRNYNLFALMAGVRAGKDSPKPMAKPRGVPDDMSVITRIDYERMDTDGHTHSWLTGDELERVIRWHEEDEGRDAIHVRLRQWGFLFEGSFSAEEHAGHGVEDVRVVFWFDN